MKHFIVIIVILFSQLIQAQGLFGKIKEAAKSTTEDVILNKTRDKTATTIDSVLSKKKGTKNTKDKKKEEEKVIESKSVYKTNFKSYSKFDFIPGELLIYYKDFIDDSIGEFPIGWNTNGSGEVVKLENYSENWLKIMQNSIILTDNSSFFDKNFTIEFDLIFNSSESELLYFPAFYFGFLSSGDKTTTDKTILNSLDENFLSKIYVGLINDGNGNSVIQLENFEQNNEYFNTGLKTFPKLDKIIEKPIHISIQIQNERFRLWINEDKVYDLPKAVSLNHDINQLFFEVSDAGVSDDIFGIYISNIRVAKGNPDLRKNLLSEGIFTTSAILFDNNSAIIKSESFGILNELGSILKKNPELNIEIEGHTDNLGSEENNLLLSEKRAKSICDFFSNEYNISKSRLKPIGKGEKYPISDNNTTEGRAKNRRVSFIKI